MSLEAASARNFQAGYLSLLVAMLLVLLNLPSYIALVATSPVLILSVYALAFKRQQVAALRYGALAAACLPVFALSFHALLAASYCAVVITASYLLIERKAASLCALILVSTVSILGLARSHWSLIHLMTLLAPLAMLIIYLRSLLASLELKRIDLQNSLKQDSVTGLPNSEALYEHLSDALVMQKRYKIPATALAISVASSTPDLDSLTRGQLVHIHRQLCALWCSRLRQSDVLCRHERNLYILILPATNGQAAASLACDLEKASNVFDFDELEAVHLTFVAVEAEEASDADTWLQKLIPCQQTSKSAGSV